MAKKHPYWFRPARFWSFFAFYYPASPAGWVATLILLTILIWAFLGADQHSHSNSDTLIGFAPWFIAMLALFDLLCFRTGEYPSWWKKWKK